MEVYMNKAVRFSRLIVMVTLCALSSFSGLSAYFFGSTVEKPKTVIFYNSSKLDGVEVCDLGGNLIAVLQANDSVELPEPGTTVTHTWLDGFMIKGGYIVRVNIGNNEHTASLMAPCLQTSYDIEYLTTVGALKVLHIPFKAHNNYVEVNENDPAQVVARQLFESNLPMIEIYNSTNQNNVQIADLNGNVKAVLNDNDVVSLPAPTTTKTHNLLDGNIESGYIATVMVNNTEHTAALKAPCSEQTYDITLTPGVIENSLKIEHEIDKSHTGYTTVQPSSTLYGTPGQTTGQTQYVSQPGAVVQQSFTQTTTTQEVFENPQPMAVSTGRRR